MSFDIFSYFFRKFLNNNEHENSNSELSRQFLNKRLNLSVISKAEANTTYFAREAADEGEGDSKNFLNDQESKNLAQFGKESPNSPWANGSKKNKIEKDRSMRIVEECSVHFRSRMEAVIFFDWMKHPSQQWRAMRNNKRKNNLYTYQVMYGNGSVLSRWVRKLI